MLDVRRDVSPRINLTALPERFGHVSRWAVWAALGEFLLLRLVIRFGPMLPPSPAMSQAAQVVFYAGTVALNVAVILTTLAMLAMAGLTRSSILRALLLAAAVLSLIRTAWPHGATPAFDVVFLIHSVVMLATMVTACVLFGAEPLGGQAANGRLDPTTPGGPGQALTLTLPLRRANLILLLGIYAALAYPALMATAARLGWAWASEPVATRHFVAESLAVLVALSVVFVYRPAQSKLALALALLATMLFGGFWMVRPHIAAALTQWTVDFAMFLPPWLYFLGLAGFIYTVVACAGSSDAISRFAAWGLALIALGGLRWDYTYFSGLSLLGFLLLAESWQMQCGKLVRA